MNLAPIWDAPLAIKIHLATVLPAFVIGTWLTKGARRHRALGAVYLGLMTVTAVATFFIRSINPGHLTLVHLFIPLTLFGVFGAQWNIRRGNVRGHRDAMIGIYVDGLLTAGGLTLLPGRLLDQVFLG